MKPARWLWILAAAITLLAAPYIHFGRAHAFQKATSPGEYEQQMWEHVKAGRTLDLRAHMAESYQCTLPGGALNRSEMLELLGAMKLTHFAIQNLKSTPNGADMVLTYDLQLQGTFRGQPIPPGRVHVLTVWQGVKRGWIEVAQAMTPDGQWLAVQGGSGGQ